MRRLLNSCVILLYFPSLLVLIGGNGNNLFRKQLRSLVQIPKKFLEVAENVVGEDEDGNASADVQIHPAWQYLLHEEVQCGESFADRIIGGEDAALGQYPWIARLGYNTTGDDEKNTVEFKCGGSLINTIYVITAAHCLKPLIPNYVRLGEHDVTTAVDCANDVCAEPPQDFIPKKIIVHEKYDNPRFSHDIGLIRLNKEALYNGWVGHICLPQPDFNLNPVGMAETAGWGIVSMDTLETADVLQTLKVPLVPLKKCEPFYKRVMKLTIEQLCAGGKIEHDACGGDSGGPLMQVDVGYEFPQYFLIGVVSFGPSMCGGEAPGVFANTTYYLKWILDHLKPVEPSERVSR